MKAQDEKDIVKINRKRKPTSDDNEEEDEEDIKEKKLIKNASNLT